MTHPVDQYVGQQIKKFRTAQRMSQTDVGRKLNISFQQIQKYEIGSNRVAASRLFELARILNRPISAFFPPENDQQTAAT